MIVMAVAFTVKTEHRDAVMTAMKTMAKHTLQENGCHDYSFYAHFDDPQKIFLFEEWKDQACLDAHFETEHMAVFKEAIGELLGEPTKITRYVVSESGPL
jgi:quinol monooxygenase YgiN